MKGLALLLIGLSAGIASAGDADPYFEAIHCKAVWTELTDAEKARTPGTDAAIAAIDKALANYVASGAKTPRAIEGDISDLKAYSSFEAHHLKDWKDCIQLYAPQ
jgi:hypothetical protein